MFFSRKKKDEIKCPSCNFKASKSYRFCPSCGNPLFDGEQEAKDFGLLGKSDSLENEPNAMPLENFGLTDKIINSLMNSVMKSMNRQIKGLDNDFDKAEIKSLPNGIRISVGLPNQNRQPKKTGSQAINITDEQIKRMSELPRAKAKSSVKRFSDKIIYELNAPGIESPQDVFISKLESGYEIKAIGSKKIYINQIPLELPLRRFSIGQNKLSLEFNSKGD